MKTNHFFYRKNTSLLIFMVGLSFGATSCSIENKSSLPGVSNETRPIIPGLIPASDILVVDNKVVETTEPAAPTVDNKVVEQTVDNKINETRPVIPKLIDAELPSSNKLLVVEAPVAPASDAQQSVVVKKTAVTFNDLVTAAQEKAQTLYQDFWRTVIPTDSYELVRDSGQGDLVFQSVSAEELAAREEEANKSASVQKLDVDNVVIKSSTCVAVPVVPTEVAPDSKPTFRKRWAAYWNPSAPKEQSVTQTVKSDETVNNSVTQAGALESQLKDQKNLSASSAQQGESQSNLQDSSVNSSNQEEGQLSGNGSAVQQGENDKKSQGGATESQEKQDLDLSKPPHVDATLESDAINLTTLACTAAGVIGVAVVVYKAYQYWLVCHADASKIIVAVLDKSTDQERIQVIALLEKWTEIALRDGVKEPLNKKQLSHVLTKIGKVKSATHKKLLLVMMLMVFELSEKNIQVLVAKLAVL